MVRLLIAAVALIILFAFAVAATLPTHTTTRAAVDGPVADGVPTSTPDGLPDLTVQGRPSVTLETGSDCDFTSTQLGTRIFFANVGDGDAPAFVVEVNGAQQTYEPGLDAGEKGTLWFPSFIYLGVTNAMLDPANEVAESDETNNSFSDLLPIPTLPPTCTPTPSATPTPTATPDRPKILGDVDCNGAITSIDALLVLQLVAALIDELACPDAADANANGVVNAADAAVILQVVAGLFGYY